MTRLPVLLLVLATTAALAAPPAETPATTETLDLDALARAKDAPPGSAGQPAVDAEQQADAAQNPHAATDEQEHAKDADLPATDETSAEAAIDAAHGDDAGAEQHALDALGEPSDLFETETSTDAEDGDGATAPAGHDDTEAEAAAGDEGGAKAAGDDADPADAAKDGPGEAGDPDEVEVAEDAANGEAHAADDADDDTNAGDAEAHATADEAAGESVPGEADRRHGDLCRQRAEDLLDAAERGDYSAATREFDATMKAALPAAKFGEAWQSLKQFGKLQARGQAHPGMGQGYYVVTTPLVFEKANLYAQVACDDKGAIAGFYVKPLDAHQP